MKTQKTQVAVSNKMHDSWHDDAYIKIQHHVVTKILTYGDMKISLLAHTE